MTDLQRSVAITMCVLALAIAPLGWAADSKIVHDAEYYILEAQHGEAWAAEDKVLDQKQSGDNH